MFCHRHTMADPSHSTEFPALSTSLYGIQSLLVHLERGFTTYAKFQRTGRGYLTFSRCEGATFA